MGRIYAYCRVSSKKQNIERQIRNILEKHPDAIIIKEVYTRTSFSGRKEWDKLMRVVMVLCQDLVQVKMRFSSS